MLRDARVSEQQFSSQPVLLARSYESIHLKLGNLTSPSLPAKSHLLPLIFFLHFLAQFAEEADVIYRRRGLLIVKLVSLGAVAEICIKKQKERKKEKDSGMSRGIMNETEQISPRI